MKKNVAKFFAFLLCVCFNFTQLIGVVAYADTTTSTGTGSITIKYIDENNNPIVDNTVMSNLDFKDYTVSAKTIDGYDLNDTADKTVTLSDSNKDVNVTFKYKSKNTSTKTSTTSSAVTVTTDTSTTSGSATVTTTTATPGFTTASTKGTITIKYVDSNDNSIVDDTVMSDLDFKEYTISAKTIDNCDLNDTATKTVTISADNPTAEVKFTYTRKSVNGTLVFKIVDFAGNPIPLNTSDFVSNPKLIYTNVNINIGYDDNFNDNVYGWWRTLRYYPVDITSWTTKYSCNGKIYSDITEGTTRTISFQLDRDISIYPPDFYVKSSDGQYVPMNQFGLYDKLGVQDVEQQMGFPESITLKDSDIKIHLNFDVLKYFEVESVDEYGDYLKYDKDTQTLTISKEYPDSYLELRAYLKPKIDIKVHYVDTDGNKIAENTTATTYPLFDRASYGVEGTEGGQGFFDHPSKVSITGKDIDGYVMQSENPQTANVYFATLLSWMSPSDFQNGKPIGGGMVQPMSADSPNFGSNGVPMNMGLLDGLNYYTNPMFSGPYDVSNLFFEQTDGHTLTQDQWNNIASMVTDTHNKIPTIISGLKNGYIDPSSLADWVNGVNYISGSNYSSATKEDIVAMIQDLDSTYDTDMTNIGKLSAVQEVDISVPEVTFVYAPKNPIYNYLYENLQCSNGGQLYLDPNGNINTLPGSYPSQVMVKGKKYVLPIPKHKNFELVSATSFLGVVSDDKSYITFDLTNSSTNVTYTQTNLVYKPKADIVVHYVDKQGNKIADDTVQTFNPDFDFEHYYIDLYFSQIKTLNVSQKSIDGYTLSNPEASNVDLHYFQLTDWVSKDQFLSWISSNNWDGRYDELMNSIQSGALKVGVLPDVTFVYDKNVVTPTTSVDTKGTITVKYVDENNTLIADNTVMSDLDIKDYTVSAKTIDGYDLNDTADKTVTLTQSDNNQIVTFSYKKKSVAVVTPPTQVVTKGSITIKYVDGNNASIANDTIMSNLDLKEYSVPCKAISGYDINDTTNKTITLTESDKDVVVTFKYKKHTSSSGSSSTVEKKGTITTKYIDDSNNKIADDTIKDDLNLGDYTISAKTIEGYDLNDTTDKKVTLTSSDRDITVTFKYKKHVAVTTPVTEVVKGTITVKYVDEDNNPIADNTVMNDLDIKDYTVSAKTIDGYSVDGDSSKTITLTKDNNSTTVIFKYTHNKGAVDNTPSSELPTKYPQTGINGWYSYIILAIFPILAVLVVRRKRH